MAAGTKDTKGAKGAKGGRSRLGIWAVRGVVVAALAAYWFAQTGVMTGAVSLGLFWAIMVLGVYITYRILDIADLTVEGSITLGASVAARLITEGIDPYLATLAAMGTGLVAGLITGLLHTKLRIPALLAGILTLTGLYSVNLMVMDRPNIPLLPNKVESVFTPLTSLGLDTNMAALAVGAICVVAMGAILYWFFGTELGSAIRATGSNPAMVRAQGVNTSRMIILGLMISNGLVGFAGALIAQYQTFSDISMGIGSIVIGLASLIIGEVLFGTRSFKNALVAVVCGAVIYRVIIAVVIGLGLPANNLKLFVAITVTLALALPVMQQYWNTITRSLRRPDVGADFAAGAGVGVEGADVGAVTGAGGAGAEAGGVCARLGSGTAGSGTAGLGGSNAAGPGSGTHGTDAAKPDERGGEGSARRR